MTGIELGPERCVLAGKSPGADVTKVSAVQIVQDLKKIRRTVRFPRRARVVAWGLHSSASMPDVGTQALLRPLVQAGFRVEYVVTPAQALALLAGQQAQGPGREAAAWVAMNCCGAAIAIQKGTELLFSREWAWSYSPAPAVRDELLQRYLLIARLAPELRHAVDSVRLKHGWMVDSVHVCGDLPDLRSITMALIEELDMEVETLDSLNDFDMTTEVAEGVGDHAPALRLAGAAAIDETLTLEESSSWTPSSSWISSSFLKPFSAVWPSSSRIPTIAAGAAVALAVVLWSLMRPEGPSDERGAVSAVSAPQPSAPPPRNEQRTDLSPKQATPVQSNSAPSTQAVTASPQRAGDSTPPAATIGRQDPPGPQATEGGTAAGAAPDQRSLSPLRDPAPYVNSIVIVPDRRLAVVDGVIMREGDSIGARVLIRIEPDAVLLREPSGYELRVPLRRRVQIDEKS